MTGAPDPHEAVMSAQEAAAVWFGRRRVRELEPEELEAFAAWLAESDDNRLAYDTLERAWSGVSRSATIPA